MGILLISFIPISSIILLFVKDPNPTRQKTMRALLIANLLFFLSPLIYAFIEAYPDGNMWSSNGSGAVMWIYLIIGPLCMLSQVVLLILKLNFSKSTA